MLPTGRWQCAQGAVVRYCPPPGPGGPRRTKNAAKPMIRQFAANLLQYFPTLALSKSGQWVEAHASSQPCGSPFGNAIILYRAKFCNRNFAPPHLRTQPAPPPREASSLARRDYARGKTPRRKRKAPSRGAFRTYAQYLRAARQSAWHSGRSSLAAASTSGCAKRAETTAAPARPQPAS